MQQIRQTHAAQTRLQPRLRSACENALCPSVSGATQPAAGALWNVSQPGNHRNPQTQQACTYFDCNNDFDQASTKILSAVQLQNIQPPCLMTSAGDWPTLFHPTKAKAVSGAYCTAALQQTALNFEIV